MIFLIRSGRQDWLERPASRRLGLVRLVFPLGEQRRGISQEARAAGALCHPEPAAARGRIGKGKVAFTLGIGVAQTEPFVKAGLPLKSLPEPSEGSPSSNGYGSLAILKNPPHPNAARIFVNWLLSKEGQDLYSRTLLHGTRRLDVETKWMAREGVEAAKDYLSVKDNERLRNYLEDKCVDVRLKSQKFAEKVLQ